MAVWHGTMDYLYTIILTGSQKRTYTELFYKKMKGGFRIMEKNLPVFRSNDELPLTLNARDVAGYLNISLSCAIRL